MRKIFIDGRTTKRLGAISPTMPPGVEQCLDGKFTTVRTAGRCSYHGGLAVRKKAIKETTLPDVTPQEVMPDSRCRKKNQLCRQLEARYRKLKKDNEEILSKYDYYPKGRAGFDKLPPAWQLAILLKEINEGLLILTGKNQGQDKGTENYVHNKLTQAEQLSQQLANPPAPVTITPDVTTQITPQLTPAQNINLDLVFNHLSRKGRNPSHYDLLFLYYKVKNQNGKNIIAAGLQRAYTAANFGAGDYIVFNDGSETLLKIKSEEEITNLYALLNQNEVPAQKLKITHTPPKNLSKNFLQTEKMYFLFDENDNQKDSKSYNWEEIKKLYNVYKDKYHIVAKDYYNIYFELKTPQQVAAADAYITGSCKTPYSEILDAKSINATEGETNKEKLLKEHTAIIKEWRKLKAKYSNTIFLFEVLIGNDRKPKYLAISIDAKDVSRTLNLTLSELVDYTPVTIFEQTYLDTYLPKLIKAGFKVAIIDNIKTVSKIGYIYQQNPYAATPAQLQNPALMTATSLLANWQWSHLYNRLLYKTQNQELTLYIIYYLYNRRQLNNYIPNPLHGQIINFVFQNNL